MKEDNWMRLVRVARKNNPQPPAEMPFGFDIRVTAEWRAQQEREDALPWARLLRVALICASLILLLSVAMNYQTFSEREPASVAIADSILQVSALP